LLLENGGDDGKTEDRLLLSENGSNLNDSTNNKAR